VCPATAAVGLLLLLLAAEERDEGEEEEASLTGVLAGLGRTAGGGRRDRTLTAGFMGADGKVLVAIVGWAVLRAWMNMGISRSASLQFCVLSAYGYEAGNEFEFRLNRGRVRNLRTLIPIVAYLLLRGGLYVLREIV
jgi:hypothetical protein